MVSAIAGSCTSATPRTEVMISIEAEPAIAAAASALRVQVLDGELSSLFDQTYTDASLELPFVVGVVPRDGDISRRFTVITSLTATPSFYEARVETGFVGERTLWLRLEITDACRSGCNLGSVDPATLEEWPGAVPASEESVDGGASACASPREGADAERAAKRGGAAGSARPAPRRAARSIGGAFG